MKHLIEFNLETLEVIKIDPIFEEVDETIIESTGIPEELIIEPITIIDSDTATVIYEGALPCDREGYTKTLYFGYEDNDNNNAVVLLNKSLTVKQPIVYAVYTEIEGWFEVANQKDVENLKLQNQGVYGLGFKSGDNTVNLTVPEINLGLNDFTVEIWARMEGCGGSSNTLTLTNASKKWYDENSLKIYSLNSSGSYPNGLEAIAFSPTSINNLRASKPDSTKNLHHIVITRQGTLVTATINGRLIKTVTQDRVLDFSKFVFDIANTTYFSLGRVFNYAMSADEVQMLWNGGRVDEVVLKKGLFNNYIPNQIIGKRIPVVDQNQYGYYFTENLPERVFATDCIIKFNITATQLSGANVALISPDPYKEFRGKLDRAMEIGTHDYICSFNNVNVTVFRVGIYDMEEGCIINKIEVIYKNCLLELLQSSIHSKGIYNTGSLGSSHDAVLSKPAETTFIKEKPYKDKQMSTGAPNFHPIAMGQEYYNVTTGDIYKASVPPVGREWDNTDWKKINI